MTDTTDLGLVLTLLREEPDLTVDGLAVRGGTEVSDDRRTAVVEHVRESLDAQLTLFLLAAELKADAVADEAQLRGELRAFADVVDERFGVDVLGTAAEHLDRVPAHVPTDLLDGRAGSDPDG